MLSFIWYFDGCSLVKKWIGKGMSNIYYWEKLTFSKLVRKVNFSERKCTSFEEQIDTRYICWSVYFGITIFSCLLSTKLSLRLLLIGFAQKIKGFYQSSLGNEIDFRDIMNVSPNILAENKISKRLNMVL